MVVKPSSNDEAGVRRLGPVPWYHDGCRTLAVRALDDVPGYEDAMIRAAIVRAVMGCDQLSTLARAINRELWALGYVADVERSESDLSMGIVEIAGGR